MTTKTSKPKEKRTRWRFDALDFFVVILPTAILLSGIAYTFWTIFMDSDRDRSFSFSACNSLRECRERSGMSKELLDVIDANEKWIEQLSKKSSESNKEGKK